ncbi:HD domain-containing phosphohydrolase [Planctobacterium marinum]|uniref:HD domain-containing phosphohydrolase n=1 Tax=Planctobacterium marinum TaxID=1631968 RepID=UPI001E3078F3|nr:HD domain-containing phosphohydrolase [Planctobacterium marinum]MCC2606035.1 GAF domain-containing protein [Planctobacterium marinum]
MEVDKTLLELVHVGIELSTENDTTKLLEKILLAAKRLSNADGGTIYGVTAEKQLKFDTLFNDSMEMYMGGSSGTPIPFPAIPIFKEDGTVNTSALVAHSAAIQKVINIEDVYSVTEYDLSGPRTMDSKTGYHTQSVLCIPMTNHEGDLNGVLQLINAQDQQDRVIAFSPDVEKSIRALASLAAVALTNRQLIDSMENLFQSFTRLIAQAIDEKSPYTGGHCRRVPELTMMIADAVCRYSDGPLKDFDMSEEEKNELSIAGWLHDCGKIATPEYVMDKSKKLECVFDRIDMVKTRFEVAKRDTELSYLRKIASATESEKTLLQDALQQELQQITDDYLFVEKANTGGEFMTPDDQQRIADIGQSRIVQLNGEPQPLLSEEEIYNLQVARGTLNNEERQVINRHMDITISMLDSLPFPKHLQRVPEYAGGHHEKMDGTGYPKGLTRDQMSVPARMMAIADIFEALTASDRPYKPAKKMSECLKIMGFMCKDQHIDPDLFEIFVKEKVYQQYADAFLGDDQVDEVSWDNIPGFVY